MGSLSWAPSEPHIQAESVLWTTRKASVRTEGTMFPQLASWGLTPHPSSPSELQTSRGCRQSWWAGLSKDSLRGRGMGFLLR